MLNCDNLVCYFEVAKLAGAVEYTEDSRNECPGNDTKQSEYSSNVGALGNAEHPFIAIAPKSTISPSGSI